MCGAGLHEPLQMQYGKSCGPGSGAAKERVKPGAQGGFKSWTPVLTHSVTRPDSASGTPFSSMRGKQQHPFQQAYEVLFIQRF